MLGFLHGEGRRATFRTLPQREDLESERPTYAGKQASGSFHE